MRRKLVIANRKMYGSIPDNQAFLKGLLHETCALKNLDCAVCVPYPYLYQAQTMLAGSSIAWGAQNMSCHEYGPYTGSVSPSMLLEFGCEYVIIGHSERRRRGYESDNSAAERFEAAIKVGLKPVFCVGETLEEHKAGYAHQVTIRELSAVIDHVGVMGLAQGVLAYEPIWAIGTGKSASPEHAQTVLAFLRGHIASLDESVAENIRILYGGSVRTANAKELFAMPDIDGGLIGSASLNTSDFIPICRAANAID
ncbi:MAG: triose-phosphate isomerase [Methylotenera sp.]|nr:triose-phosphate isomerase [Methylotenera sp.]